MQMTRVAPVFVVLASLVSQALAQGMPDHVRGALGKLVGHWQMVLEDGDKKAVSEIDIKWANDKSVILFTWKGTDFTSGRKTSSTGIIGWDAVRQVVVEHEIGADGSTFHGTHHIAKDGTWVSPHEGSMVVDGKPVFFESHRKIVFVSKDKWIITGTNWTLGEEPSDDGVGEFTRK
jgi:hypothetical protein